jgi:TPP-dependent trihydroxycyclohexane-1,2-dione (THcHDO) dehydratase
MLSERLDHHRGRGQQQITVKHVTTNNVTADQAIIADSVTTGGGARNAASPALLAVNSETPMPMLDGERQPDPVRAGVGVKRK